MLSFDSEGINSSEVGEVAELTKRPVVGSSTTASVGTISSDVGCTEDTAGDVTVAMLVKGPEADFAARN